MNIDIHKFTKDELHDITDIWNKVVEDSVYFPQTECLSEAEAESFFSAQSFTASATDLDSGKILGMYILHPNNIGRCGHIANASFAVAEEARSMGIGRKLVVHCLQTAKELGFGILQFNAVVKNNLPARKLYQSLGFCEIGTVPNGFKNNDGSFEDIVLYYHSL